TFSTKFCRRNKPFERSQNALRLRRFQYFHERLLTQISDYILPVVVDAACGDLAARQNAEIVAKTSGATAEEPPITFVIVSALLPYPKILDAREADKNSRKNWVFGMRDLYRDILPSICRQIVLLCRADRVRLKEPDNL